MNEILIDFVRQSPLFDETVHELPDFLFFFVP
jgi:hypothetical protein